MQVTRDGRMLLTAPSPPRTPQRSDAEGEWPLHTFKESGRTDGPANVSRLAEDVRIVDDLQKRPWGAPDGQVIDRYGLKWLIGYEGDENH